MKIKKRVEFKGERLNLVPIMDAVFIFIFFLIFSAQFIKIFEIDSSAPVVSNKPPPKNEKEPLNLTIKIMPTEIIVTTGLESKVYTTIYKNNGEYNLKKLNAELFKLKKDHLKDEDVVVNADPSIKYEHIVNVIDMAKTFPDKMKTFKVMLDKKEKIFKSMFNRVVLEPNI